MFLKPLVLSNKVFIRLSRRNLAQYCRYSTNLQHKLNAPNLKNYIQKVEQEYKTLLKIENKNSKDEKRFRELSPVIQILQKRQTLIDSLASVDELLKSEDDDMKKLAAEEKEAYNSEIVETENELIDFLIPTDVRDKCASIILEVSAGVGGQEAMLFARELFDMYCNFISYKNWDWEIAQWDETDLGGIRHASIIINGNGSFKLFKYEAGVHRVQRVPSTERSGRIHTSTVSIIVLPQPEDIDINLQTKDLRIETKRASGAGGQHVNTTDSAVRITHVPSGISVDCQVDRSQIKNRQIAMQQLRARLYDVQYQKQMEQSTVTRKSQVQFKNRNEKIRTYNFNQDRITDHRLQGCNVHNLKVFLSGGAELEELITKLKEAAKQDILLEMLNSKEFV